MPLSAPSPRLRRSLLPSLALLALAPLPASPQGGLSRSEPAAWVGAGALFVGSLFLDRAVDSAVPEGGGTRLEWASDGLNHLGRPQELLPALAGVYLAGKLAGSGRVSASAAHVAAAVLAGGVPNAALKFTVGRERPSVTDDPHRYFPFSSKNARQSFPSGHVVVVFAAADALSREAGRPWVSALGYGTAALVAWSRVYDDKHWTSDVVGGAIIGVLSSRAALGLLHRRFPHEGTDAPRVALGPGGISVSLPVRRAPGHPATDRIPLD
ncbi:MAG TPA: phosphatase PAP2 family protein [Longimicrobiaceae bacterium]|nr:phosphatase PAP2 family protein [Longimicrobiaceae bacterium]